MMKKTGVSSVIRTAVVAFVTCSAVALGEEGAAHSAAPSIFEGDLGNIFWSLVTFLLVLVVLGKFAWKPILGGLQSREEFIRDSLAQAKKDRESAEARLKEYGQKLETARAEATELVEEGRRDAEAVKHTIEETAKKEAAAMVERAKREISLAKDTAVKELYTLGARLATDVAGRIIKKELDPKDHERLIAESIGEFQALSGNGSRN